MSSQDHKPLSMTLAAPNGKPSNLSPDLYAYVRTEDFKQWFGDWQNDPQNASRILDENGEPMVLYRGQMSHANVPFINHGDGIYFTPQRKAAIGYGADHDPIPVFLNAKNVYVVDFEGDSDIENTDTHADIMAEYHNAQENGYDILIATNTFDGENDLDQYVVHNDAQIRRIDSLNTKESMGRPTKPKTYGAPYQGSKNRIADKIIETLPKGKRFVDLFSGGGAVAHAALISNRFSTVHINDRFPAGQRLFIQGVKGKWQNKQLKPITEEDFKKIIGTPEAIVRSVRAVGKSLAKKNNRRNRRDRAQEQLKRVQKLELLKPYEHKIQTSELDYSQVKLNKDDVVYCDIPYENTRQDGYVGKFDKQKFMEWAQQQDIPIYVSEYYMPKGWTEIASFNAAGKQKVGRQEKLFVQDKFAEQYFAAKEEEYKEHLTNKTTNMQFQFIGETGALQLDKATQSLSILLNLATAKEMADADKNPLTIKMATGWEKGIDNKWRYEIPDKIMPVSSLSLLRDGMTDGTTATLNDIFTKAPFLDAYPQLANMPVVVDKERAAGASFNPETRQITISANELRIFDNSDDLNAEEVSATIIHEIQHAIQYIEGFAQGGNIQTVANQQRKEAEAQMNALSDIYSQYQMIDFRTLSNDTQEALQAFKERDDFEAAHETELMTYLMARTQLEMAELDMVAGRLQKNNFDNYQKIAGEVEARNAARRAYMTPEERRNSLAAATEDIVREQQIVILNNIRPLLGENTSPLLHNDIVLRDRLIQLMQVAGIAVNTNWQEGQNVLDMANNQAKLQQSQTRDSYLKAPNGEKTNLQNDQWAQVRTDEFKNWYGDWQNDPQNASKLIDQNDEPMVLYHGTNVEFNTFEQHEGLRWHGWGEQFTANAKGFFFSDNFDDAKKHAHSNAFMKGGEEIVMPVYVSMKNPADLSGDGKNDIEELFHDLTGYYPLEHPDYHRRDQWWRIVEDEEFDIPAKLKELGYDGIIFAEKVSEYTDVTEEKSYYVTNPNQIKSATINNGEFSLNNNDIRFQLADSSSLSLPTQQPIFISNALLALQQIQQQKATPQQWFGMLKNLNGIKPGEDRWTGLSDWLANNTEKTLTKQQVLDYIAQNQIVVEETHYENLEDFPRFKELYKEYLDEIKNVNDLYWEAKQNYDDFYNRMVEKYGQNFDIESDLTEEEREEEEELFNEKDGYDTYEVSAEEQAFKLMVDKYGEKFEWAFSHDGDMLIIENDEDAGIFLYDDKVKQINDTRLRYTTQELDNKHEITLTVPTIESWNENDEIHFGDADNGRAIAWIRFGETMASQKVSEEEIQRRIDNMPKAEEWEKVDGSNFVNKHDVYFFPGTRNKMGHSYIWDDNKGHFSIEGPMARQMLNIKFDSLQEAVNAYNRQWVKTNNNTTNEKILVIDEIQSKRHQEGREKGYRSVPLEEIDASYKKLKRKIDINRQQHNDFMDAMFDKYGVQKGEGFDKIYNWLNLKEHLSDEEKKEDQRLEDEYNHLSLSEVGKSMDEEYRIAYSKIPDAPFEKNWHELAMKRMLRYAAENGYDRVAWTTGDQQAERYNIGNVINEIVVGEKRSADDLNNHFGDDKIQQDAKLVTLMVKNSDNTLSLAVNDDGKIIYCHETEEMDNKNLDQLVGKKLAEEVLKADNQTFSVDDIKVGMEGMIAFYDQMLPNFINKYTKKWNTHTEDVQIPNIEDYGIKTTLHSVPVTPQMKDDVMQGQPMFFLTPQGNAYGYTFNNTIYIDPRIATSETPIHEYAHLWAQAMRQYNAEEWQNIVSLMKQVKPVWDMVQRQYSHLASDSDIAEEVLAQYTGKQGMKRLERALKNYDNDISDQQAENIIERIKAAIDRFWQKTADFLHIHYESADQVASRVIHDMINQVNPQRLAQQLTQDNTQQKPALAQQPVIRTYSTAPYLDVQTLAHRVKDGDKESIKEAAQRMAETINVIPDKNNLVLVPMPSHDGYATYTKTLSEEIAKLTGLPFKDVLTAQPHASLYDFKLANGIHNLPLPSVSLTNDLPEGKIPLIIDNVLDTGTTAYAASQAFGPDTNARVAVLGNTDNFYHFHNGIVLESEKLLDIRYLNAVERGDLETAQQMVNAQAQKMGYSFEDIERDAHVAPGATLDTKDLRDLNLHAQNIENGEDVNLFAVANGISPQPDDYFTHSMAPKWYMYNDQSGMESQSAILSAIRNIQYQTKHDGEVKEMPKVTVFRAVPKEVREDHIRRNGEWVSPSLSYAINHGEHRLGIDNYRIIKEAIPADQLWWDGNDIREWGVDDGRSYAFRNTPNNAKLLDPVTYDNQGNVIPLSQRFNAQNPEFRFQLAGQQGAAKLDAIDHKGRIENLHVAQEMEKTNHTPKEIKISTGWERGADNKWRYEIPDAYLNPNASITKYADLKTEFMRLIDVAYNEKNMARQQRTYRQADRIRDRYLMMPFNEKSVGELLSADADIFKAYPEIANIKLKIEQDVLMTLKGYYDETNNTIMLNLSHLKSQDDIRSTLLHEIQHFIQTKEGFAQGANIDQQIPDVVIRDVKNNIEELQRGIEDKQKTLNEIHEQLPEMRQLLDQVKVAFKTHGVGSPEIIKAMQDVNEFKSLHKEKFNIAQQLNFEIDDDNKKIESLHKYLKDNVLGYDEYTKMAGEVEARNVQSRMLRNPDINARTTTESTEDVPRSQQTVIFNNGTTSQQTDAPSVAPSQQQNLSPTTQQTAKQQSDKPSKPFNMPNQTPQHDYIQEFLDTKSKLQAAKADQNLSKMVRFEMPDGSKQVMTNAAYIQYAIKHNLTVAATPEKGNIPDSKVQQINRAFNSANENIVKRDLGKYYKPTHEMMAYEKILNRRFSSRGDERPSNQEMGQARQKAIESIIDANTPTTMFYHVKIDNAGASMPISKTMYDYAAFIQKSSIEELTKQLKNLLSEPQFNEWLHKNEDGVVLISEADILRLKDGQLQLGWYHMPEDSKQPEFVIDDLTKRDFYQQINIITEGIENATALHQDMKVESLLNQLNTDRISLEEPITVRLTKGETVTINAVAQEKPGHNTYLVSGEADTYVPYVPYYVNSDDFNKVIDKAIENGSQQLLAQQTTNDQPISQSSDQQRIVDNAIESLIQLELAQKQLKLAAMMVDTQINKMYIDDTMAGLNIITGPDKTQNIIVNAVSMGSQGEMKVITETDNEYPIEHLNLPDQIKVIDNAMRMVKELKQTENQESDNKIAIDHNTPTEDEHFNQAMADARKHIENAFPDSFISLSDPLKHDDTLSVIIDGKDTHIFPVSLPEDFKEDHNFGFVVQMPSDDNMAFMAVETAINNVDEMEVINEKSVLFYDINDAIEFKQQANLLTELHKLNELEKKAKMELPFANPQWKRDNEQQIEGAKLMMYGIDSGIRAEYLDIATYEGKKPELGFAVGNNINMTNIDSLTQIYSRQNPEQQMFNNGGDDLTVKFLDVREAMQFQSFVNQLVNAEPKMTQAQTQNMAEIKERYPNTIILNRNDSNYEAYGKDAERLSSLLELPTNYDKGFAVTRVDASEIDDALIEIITKGEHATVVDNKELSIRTQAKVMNEIGTQLIETFGEGHHSLIGHPPTEQLPGFHLATKNKLGYMNITSLDLSNEKVPTVSLNSENGKTTMSLLLLSIEQQQDLLQYAKALNTYQSMQHSIDEHVSQQTTNKNNGQQTADVLDVAVTQQQSLEQKTTQLINELGLNFTPVALRTPVVIPADLDDWQGQDVILSHVMLANDKIIAYSDRNDAYDNINGINISELSAGTQSEILDKIKEQLSDDNRQITVHVDTANVPEWAINALINGDHQGLSEKETKMVNDFYNQYPDHIFSPRHEDTFFDNHPAFGEPTNTISVDIVRIATPAMLRQEVLAEKQTQTADQQSTDIYADKKISQQATVEPSQNDQTVGQTPSQTDVPSVDVPQQQPSQQTIQQSQTNDGTNNDEKPLTEAEIREWAEREGLPITFDPLDNIRHAFRESGLIAMPVKFDYDDRRFMDIDGIVRTPFLNFNEDFNHRMPELVIAPDSVEYQKENDRLLLHGKNANGDLLTIPFEPINHWHDSKYNAYEIIAQQLQKPLEEAFIHAYKVEHLAADYQVGEIAPDTFMRNITDSNLRASNGNIIHVGEYSSQTKQLHVTESNELNHKINDTWMDALQIAKMIADKEAVAILKDNLVGTSLSYPSLEEVTAKRTEISSTDLAKLNDKYLNTVFSYNGDSNEERAVIVGVRQESPRPWNPTGVELSAVSISGAHFTIVPDSPDNNFKQTGNKIDGIIQEIEKRGFIDREKNMPYNLMDPISYSRDNNRISGPEQTSSDNLMVDFGPNHFYFQQTLSGQKAGKYYTSYEIENLDHSTKIKVVDMDVDTAVTKMLHALSDYDLRHDQSHSLNLTESEITKIVNTQPFKMVDLNSHIHNIPAGDSEMAIDPLNPKMDVSMVNINDENKVILHGNGGPAPLDSLDETARFEVVRRIANDLRDQNLDISYMVSRLQHLGQEFTQDKLMMNAFPLSNSSTIVLQNAMTIRGENNQKTEVSVVLLDPQAPFSEMIKMFKDWDTANDYQNGRNAEFLTVNEVNNADLRPVLHEALQIAENFHSSFSINMSNPNSEEKIMKPDEQKPQVEQPKADQSQSPAREQATEQIRTAIGPDKKVKLDENERVALETNKGATIIVQTVSITKNENVSIYGELDGTKKSISANQLADGSLSKLANHLDDLRSAKQDVSVEKPVTQKADAEIAQKPVQENQTAQEQKVEQPKERKVEPIEIKPDSKVEFNITKNPVLDRVYDIQLFVDGEKKAGHHLSIEDRKDFFDKKVTGPELVPKYFEKELAGQKLPEVIERHHAERKQEAQEQKPAQEQKAPEQKVEQTKERKANTIEIKPDSKVQVNVVPNKALDHVYDIQLYVDGQKQGRGHHLSIEDRKAFFEKSTPEEKTAFAASLLPKYFEKELAGQKLPENINRYRAEKKQETQEQKTAQTAEQKPTQEQKTGASPIDVWKNARSNDDKERMTFVQRDGQYGKFYQTYGDDAVKVAKLTEKPTKEIKEGPNANMAYINVKQADMPNLMKTMKEQDLPYKVVGMDGKYARVLPEAQAKTQTQAADLSGYKMPEGKQVSDVKVWQFQNKPYMNGVVNGNKLEQKEISKEDWTAFKGQKATPEQLVGKYYSPAEMEGKQAQKQTKSMSR